MIAAESYRGTEVPLADGELPVDFQIDRLINARARSSEILISGSPTGSTWFRGLGLVSVSGSAARPLQRRSGHRVSGSEQLHEFWEGGGEAALPPFEVGFISHGLA